MLDTPDLLALCLRVRGSRDRLRLYLSLLRQRGGARAQLASCLVCFDLAQKGDDLSQREFTALAPTVMQLSLDAALVEGLIAGDPYLQPTWAACRDALDNLDPREQSHLLEESVEVGELDLLSDMDLDLDLELDFDVELEIDVDDSMITEAPPDVAAAHLAARQKQARQEYSTLLSRYIGQIPEHGAFAGQGFYTARERDMDKLEAFLRDCDRYSALVPEAMGMVCMGHLYLATHLRMRTLFGRLNPRRVQAVTQGLERWPLAADALGAAASVFELEGPHAVLGLEKVQELLMDYVLFCAAERLDPLHLDTCARYAVSERQPKPVLLNSDQKRRRG